MFDIRSCLSIPFLYTYFQELGGSKRLLTIYAEEYIQAKSGDRILDIGCGPGNIVDYLPSVDYVGFDINQQYIDLAIKKFGRQAAFYCQSITPKVIQKYGWSGSFDIVLANGVIHHLNDHEAIQLFEIASKAMKPEGRLVTHDLCYIDNQSALSRFLCDKDRGQYVRKPVGYVDLASNYFLNVRFNIRGNLCRIPRHMMTIMECSLS